MKNNDKKEKYEQLLRKKIKLEEQLRVAEKNVKKLKNQIERIQSQLKVYA